MAFQRGSEHGAKIYEQLDSGSGQIRLVKLQPGTDGSPVKLSLMVTTLPEKASIVNIPGAETKIDGVKPLPEGRRIIEYEAISYCWCDPTLKAEVILNGIPFEAPYSAVEVLQNVRLEDKERILWIDALCINQHDLEEKANQIPLMRCIYENSARTIIWLGLSPDNSRTLEAFQLCETVSKRITDRKDLYELSELETLAESASKVTFPADTDLTLLDVVFFNPWFTRLWVWQEAALSPSCICQKGNFTIPWRYVMLTAWWWLSFEVTSDYKFPPGSEALASMFLPFCVLHQKVYLSFGTKLSWLVDATRNCIVSEPRDKIFGLLGMTRWAANGRPLPVGITPDYQESLRNCMRNATRVMIEEDGHLEVLRDVRLYAERDSALEYKDWPSWAPMWQLHANGHDFPGRLYNSYNAANEQPLDVDKHKHMTLHDADGLALDGFKMNRIERSHLIPRDSFSDVERTFAEVSHLYHCVENVPYYRHILPHLFVSTLIAYRLSNEASTEMNLAIIQRLIGYLSAPPESSHPTEITKSEPFPNPLALSKEELAQLGDLRWDLMTKSAGHCIFMLSDGRMGLGPGSMECENIVAVIFGARCPIVLRRKDTYYSFVGYCYVHGIMDGEFVREMEAKGTLPMTFEVR